MSLLEGTIDSRSHPLAVVEDIAASNNWPFERSGEDELTIVSKGQWTDYQISFTWMGEIEALHLACAFDMKIPVARRGEVQRLVAAVNEQLAGLDIPDCYAASGLGVPAPAPARAVFVLVDQTTGLDDHLRATARDNLAGLLQPGATFTISTFC